MQQALDLIRGSLKDIYPKGEIEGFIRLIFDRLCGFSTTDILLKRDMVLLPDIRQNIVSIVERLKLHEPVQYVLGKAYFGELPMEVGEGVLIPRPETAEMVECIIKEQDNVRGRVLDICTGSGCIAIALALAWQDAKVEGWDISPKALEYAQRNATYHHATVVWRECDILAYNPQKQPHYDVIVSNPPYILDSERANMDRNVLDYEPHLALFVSDNNPLLFYKAIARIAWHELYPGGRLYFEINSRMGRECCEMLQNMGFVSVEIYKDFMELNRVVRAIRP